MLLRQRFRQWRQGRPFWGALLTVLAGVELFVAGRSDLAVGGVVLQLGFSGMQTTIIPIVIVLAGVLAMAQPVHHIFYGVITLVLSVYAVVAVNLGGLLVGSVLGIVGSIVVVSWMGARQTEPEPEPEPAGLAQLFDDGPPRESYGHRWSGVALAVALATGSVAGGVSGAVPADGSCLLGVLLCDEEPSPTASPSPSAETPSPSGSPEPSPDPTASDPAPADPTSEPSDPAPAPSDPAPTPSEAAPTPSGEQTPAAPEPEPQAPADDGVPLVHAGAEDVEVYAVPAELKAADLEIAGLRSVSLVTVPVGNGTGERRNALKIVADHVKVTGFRLRTYAGAGNASAGTETTADHVVMDGAATMYITSLTATGPDGETFRFDADAPPPTLTSLVLAALNPTVGLLGATSDTQVWSGFREHVWTR